MTASAGTFLSLFVIGSITDVSIYSINLTTALGLGLAIDYSLFFVARCREELVAGMNPHDAVVRTVETAGRAVYVLGIRRCGVPARAARLFALLPPLVRYAGISVVLIAAAGAVVALPALLADFGLPTSSALPKSAESRQVSDRMATGFTSNTSEQFAIVAPTLASSETAAVEAYAITVFSLPNVASVTTASGTYAAGKQVNGPATSNAQYASGATGVYFSVTPSVRQRTAADESLVRSIRSLHPSFTTAVEGSAAQLIDTKAAIGAHLPYALGIIAVVTFVLLFLVFGSVLVPLKAIVLNLLSLTATFGAMVWIFQQGHGAGLLGFTADGTLDTSMPILMFCIAFGLSMDYEVFLLSRIKEEYDRTVDNTHAVATGLERTGRIVTAAAALLAVTFASFGLSGVTFIKMFGIGLALAIVMDATLIRGLLVPAFMRLAGDANCWAPPWMRRIHNRFGISEHGSPVVGIVYTTDVCTAVVERVAGRKRELTDAER